MKNIVLACVVVLASCPLVMAGDIAISTHAGWFSQGAADREMQEIVDNVTAVAIERFTADEQDALADWVVAHTGDGVADLLILCGQFPATIYPAGNAQPDGSIAELFLDDGNIIVNTGDYMFYVTPGGNGGEGGLRNMMDIPGISMWDDNTPVVVTAEGQAITPTLVDFQTDRPFHLNELVGPWFAELVLAQNEAGTRADAVIVANAETGGRLGIFYQTASQDDDPRGEVMSEWINNWYLTAGEVVNPGFPALNPSPADGAVDVVMPLFEWEAGWGAAMHEVYFGDSPDTLTLKMTTPALMYFHAEVMEPGKTYYWRIDEIDAVGTKVTGDVWSFTTFPVKATQPNPADGATNLLTAVQLGWKAGLNAQTHDVYFGTDPDALTLLETVDTDSYAIEGLETDSTYYWKVDEHDTGGAMHAGDTWSFSTVPVIEPVDDPNLVGWWTFDTETATTASVLDMSGNGNHGVIVGALGVETDPDMGQVLGLPGGTNQFVDIGAVGISGTDPTTIGCWAKADHTSIPDWTLIFGFTGTAEAQGGCGSHFNIGSLGGPGGVGAHAWCWEETIFSDQQALEWHHYAMTYDGTTIAYYGDASPMDTDPGKSNVQDLSIRGDRVHIGSRVTQGSSFPGLVDDCRIYDYAMTADEIRQTFGDPLQAYQPDPAAGASGVSAGAILSWMPGDDAVEHDVYLGADEAAVADADATDDTGIYRGRQAETAYAADALASDTTYYWRVDEVDGDGNVVVGKVWNFKVAPGIPVEANLGACMAGVPGFLIHSLKPENSDGWSYDAMNEIFDTGLLNGSPAIEEGSRIDEFVNLRDTGNGAFSEANGYPDKTFPGIDPLEVPAQDPAAGDDDNNYGTEVLGCIHLTAGMHQIGANSDDGTIVWIGGVEIGRTGEWKGASNVDLPPFEILEEGYYSLKARWLEGGGGSSLELHEILADGTRLLLNDVANGGSAVFAPKFVEDFEAYAAGSDLHGQGGWKGWDNDAAWGAPASDAVALSGAISAEIGGNADLVHEFGAAGGVWSLSVMQYIPSGTTGENWFILLNQYNDAGDKDWSLQYVFNLGTGTVTSQESGGTAQIVYDQWIELNFVIDLDNNTADGYYNGELVGSQVWDDTAHATIGAVDLFGNGASAIYYDDMVLEPALPAGPIIASVVRSNGVSGDRDPIGAYDGTTAPLPTEEGGLMDGAMVFSDRTYPWAGIPAEYVGSEYIRTFNSDKNGGTDPAYEVTTSTTAIVWITVDDRIPEEWDDGGAILSQQDAADAVTAAFAAPGTFVDTGIDIYVREKDDGTRDRPMSVFAAELPAGTYVFGRMDSGKNFYTIGAVPAQ